MNGEDVAPLLVQNGTVEGEMLDRALGITWMVFLSAFVLGVSFASHDGCRSSPKTHRRACPWSDCECQPGLQHVAPNARHAYLSGAATERTSGLRPAVKVEFRAGVDRWQRGSRIIFRR